MQKFRVLVYFEYEIEAKNKQNARKKGLKELEDWCDKPWTVPPSVEVEEAPRWL
jgi:hypothetical protein